MNNRLYHCYGTFSDRQNCRDCEVADYCKEAGDISPSRGSVRCEGSLMDVVVLNNSVDETYCADNGYLKRRKYSYEEFAELVQFMVSMSEPFRRAFAVVLLKTDVDKKMTLQAIANELGVSKQAIHQVVNRGVLAHPALAKVFLHTRKKKKRGV